MQSATFCTTIVVSQRSSLTFDLISNLFITQISIGQSAINAALVQDVTG